MRHAVGESPASKMYEVARWLAVEAQYMRSCWGSHPRTIVKNESGTHEFPCSSVGPPLIGEKANV